MGTLGFNCSIYLPSRCYAISLCIESPSPQEKSDKGSFSDFFLREGGGGGVCIQAKTGRCRGYFGSWGHVLVAVAVVERWPLQRGLSKSQRPRLRIFKVSVAIVERSTWESTEINPT